MADYAFGSNRPYALAVQRATYRLFCIAIAT
jgi:hypothetical protein